MGAATADCAHAIINTPASSGHPHTPTLRRIPTPLAAIDERAGRVTVAFERRVSMRVKSGVSERDIPGADFSRRRLSRHLRRMQETLGKASERHRAGSKAGRRERDHQCQVSSDHGDVGMHRLNAVLGHQSNRLTGTRRIGGAKGAQSRGAHHDPVKDHIERSPRHERHESDRIALQHPLARERQKEEREEDRKQTIEQRFGARAEQRHKPFGQS